MKRLICVVLILCLMPICLNAYAITGSDALGLTSGDSSSAYPVLQVGSKDADDGTPYVLMMQKRLIELNYLSRAADGHYGSATETAVVMFQEANGLFATGIADSKTQELLFSSDAVRSPTSMAEDADVLRVQQMLSRWGFMTGLCDGIAGPATETAVAEFKSYLYLDNAAAYAACATPTPVPEATLPPDEQPVADDVPLSLVRAEAERITVNGFDGRISEDVVKFANGEYTFQPYRTTLRKGDMGSEVWRIQRRLCQCNYLYKPDGSFGNLTEIAVRYFQKKNGLEETGVADQATQEKLFTEDVAFSEEYIFPYKVGVDRSAQRVYVFEWDGSAYSKQVKAMKCSTGMRGAETPAGTFQADGKATTEKWYYMGDYGNYVQYAYRIIGGIMFHSVLFNSAKQGPTNSSVAALGRPVSHGCIRLAIKDAKWIFDNCPEGTTVVIR